jgi:hypothetical protein
MHAAGRSVRVGIRDGCIIHEIRPWRITKSADPLGGPEIRKALEKIFRNSSFRISYQQFGFLPKTATKCICIYKQYSLIGN